MFLDLSNTSDFLVYEKHGERLHFGSGPGGATHRVGATMIEDTEGNQITISGAS